MGKTELMQRANTGDVNAILELVNLYITEKDWTSAIEWADKAAATGNMNGIYRAAELHHLRAMSLLRGDAEIYHLMMEDGKATYQNAGVLISLLQTKGKNENGLDEKSLEMYDQLLTYFRDGLYCEACAYYSDEKLVDKSSDPLANCKRAFSLLKDVKTTRECALCGLCCFFAYNRFGDVVDRDAESKKRFEIVFKDEKYKYAEKTKFEERVLDNAASFYALMLNAEANYDKAVSVLQYAVAAIKKIAPTCEYTLKTDYKRTIFGEWKFVGKR